MIAEIYRTDDSKMILSHSILSMNSIVTIFHSYRLSLWDSSAALPEYEEGSEVHVSVYLHKRGLQKQPLALHPFLNPREAIQ